jgi:hypothetical protein
MAQTPALDPNDSAAVAEILASARPVYECWLERTLGKNPIRIATYLVEHRTSAMVNDDSPLPHLRAAKAIATAMEARHRRPDFGTLPIELTEFWERKVFLKGFAYQNAFYLQHLKRKHVDVDVFIEAERKDEFFAAAQRSGWHPLDRKHQRPGETQSSWKRDFVVFDVHWRISASPIFADVLSFDDAWSHSIPLPDQSARWLGLENSLTHSSLHYLASGKSSQSDQNLLDIYTISELLRRRGVSILEGWTALAKPVHRTAFSRFSQKSASAPDFKYHDNQGVLWKTVLNTLYMNTPGRYRNSIWKILNK